MKDQMIARFDEETRKRMRAFFERALEEADGGFRKTYDALLKYSNEKQYPKVSNFVRNVKKHYVGTIKEKVMQAYEKWFDEGTSIHNELKKTGNDGFGRYEEAKKFEEHLRECLAEKFIKELDDPTESADLKDDKTISGLIEDMVEKHKEGIKSLEHTAAEVQKKINGLIGEESHYYMPIGILLGTIFKIYIEFLEKMCAITKGEFKDKLEAETAKLVREENDERKKLQSFAKEVSEALKLDADIFDNLFW